MVRLSQFKKALRELLLLVRKCARDDDVLLVQPVEGLSELAFARFIDRKPVLFKPVAFGLASG